MVKEPGHEYAVSQGEELLRALVPLGWHVRNRAPIALARSAPAPEPAPDLTIVRGDRAAYRRHHPVASEVALVVEVADRSLEAERAKGKAYGAAGIAEYWIVNLVERCVETHTQPDPASETGYAHHRIHRADEWLVLHLAGQALGTLAVIALLP